MRSDSMRSAWHLQKLCCAAERFIETSRPDGEVTECTLPMYDAKNKEGVMRTLLIILSIAILTGCESGYSEFYRANFDRKALTEEQARELKFLPKGETPEVRRTDNMKRDVNLAQSRYWVLMGYSSFNGELGTPEELVRHAKSVGATMVLVSAKFSENRQITGTRLVSTNSTTYFGGGATGMATSYGTAAVPVTRTQTRYDQEAVFFVRSTKKQKFGVGVVPLTPELRQKYERNTGALVNIVFEDSPAFRANLLPGDVITELGGKAIETAPEVISFIAAQPANGSFAVKILRNGGEKTLNVQLVPQ